MRIWEGDEREGKHMGALTLFIDSEWEVLTCSDFELIQNLLVKKDYAFIYFGAGRKNVIVDSPQETLDLMVDLYTNFPNIQIKIEIDLNSLCADLLQMLPYLVSHANVHPIFTVADMSSKFQFDFKIEDNIRKEVWVYNSYENDWVHTNIDEVSKGMYMGDIELYNNKKDKGE